MTEKEIRQRVEEIRDMQCNSEGAHFAEDSLHRDFITYVAESFTGSLSTKARIVLSSQDIEFSRWYA